VPSILLRACTVQSIGGTFVAKHLVMVVPEFNYWSMAINISVRGFNSEPLQSFLKRDKWILPAPRASGLHRKLQCGVPFSIEERQKTKNSNHILLWSTSGALKKQLGSWGVQRSITPASQLRPVPATKPRFRYQ
jgi:hypothetical protein